MNKSDGKCRLCKNSQETICHLLYECNLIKPVWQKVQDLIHAVTKFNANLNLENIVFGFQDAQDVKSIFNNFIIYNTKWCIWKHRNCVRYGNENVKSQDAIYKQILDYCKDTARIILKGNEIHKSEFQLKMFLESLASDTDM